MTKIVSLAIAMLCFSVAAAQDNGSVPLILDHSISLPGVTGRFDHFQVDHESTRLFLPAEEAHSLILVDLINRKAIAKAGGFVKPHAVCYRSDKKELLVTDDDGTYKILASDSLNLKQVVHLTYEYADGLRYDPATRLAYVVNAHKADENPEHDSILAIIDTDTWKHVGDIHFKGAHIEEVAIESSGPRLFVGIVSRSEIGIIDRQQKKQVGAWPLPIPGMPYGLVMDDKHHRLFVALRKPGKLLVMNTDNGQMVAQLDAPNGIDDIFYDPTAQRIYVSAGVANEPEGHAAVYQQIDANHYRFIAQVATGSASATSLLDAKHDRFYVATQAAGSRSAQIQSYRINP